MSRFPELKGLSILIKINVFLVIASGLLIALLVDTGWARLGGLVISLLVALAYWIQARFIDILLQINGNMIDTLDEVRSRLPAVGQPSNVGSARQGSGAPSRTARKAGMSWVIEPVADDTVPFDLAVTEERGSFESSIPVLISNVPEGTSIRFYWHYPSGRKSGIATSQADDAGSCLTEIAVPSDAHVGSHQLFVSTPLGSVSLPVGLVFAR
jgi:hypothetical protein